MRFQYRIMGGFWFVLNVLLLLVTTPKPGVLGVFGLCVRWGFVVAGLVLMCWPPCSECRGLRGMRSSEVTAYKVLTGWHRCKKCGRFVWEREDAA